MEYKDIKIEETYNMRVKVISVDSDAKATGVATIPVDKNGNELENEWTCYGLDIASAFSPITLENGIKNTESAPKYAPCRLFRKGDKVSPLSWNDRPPTAYDINEITAHFIPEDGLYSVSKDELPDSTVLVEYKGKIISMQACHLELMTPVEGYFQVEGDEDEQEYYVVKGALFVASYGYGPDDFYKKEEAKAAAQA